MRSGCVAVFVVVLSLGTLAQPKLAADSMVYDFGEVAEGFLVVHSFILRNAGTGVLNFTRQPSTDCGCTTAGLPKMSLHPGEQLELRVNFDSTGFSGRVTKLVYVYSNDPSAPTFTLTVRGAVRKALPYEGSASTLRYGFYLLVDLRSPAAYAQGRLLGAINIPLTELATWIPRLPKDRKIYLYDETGAQALQAVQTLRGQGFLGAYAVAGGLVQWWRELGDLFFLWAEGAARSAPVGSPATGPFSLVPTRIAQAYQVILDFRSKEAYAQGRFLGSINLTLSDLQAFAARLPKVPQGFQFTVWCVDEDGAAATQAAQYLYSLGFSAKVMVGGLAQWRLRYGDELLWPEPLR